LMDRQCALVRAELAQLRADLTGAAAPDPEPPERNPPPERGAPDAPDEA
jgi:hypothetical protein